MKGELEKINECDPKLKKSKSKNQKNFKSTAIQKKINSKKSKTLDEEDEDDLGYGELGINAILRVSK